MRVAADSDFGEVNHGDVATLPVHGIPPQPCHGQTCPPAVLARMGVRLLRNVVTVVNDNRNLRELLEFSR